MPWLYRLQAHVGLTAPEGLAIVLVALGASGGLLAQQVRGAQAAPPPDLYAAADAAFARADAQADSASTTPPPDAAGDATLAPRLPVETLAEDSTGTEIAEAAVAASDRRSRTRKPPPVPTNINTASEADLQRLPRIGPALAARIVEYRRVNGRFRTAAQIQEVKGIGEKTFEKLAPWIRL